jgi:threonine synthase
LVQILAYQATLKRIPGSRHDTALAALKRAESLYYASHSWNPYFFQGTKTVAFEIWEDLDYTLPDTLILPVGNGTLFLGAYLGFKELQEAGLIDSLPRLIGIQTAQCAPLYESFHAKSATLEENSSNLAEGIAIAEPIRGPEILKAVKETGGTLLAVSEAQIKEALQLLCSKGFFVEPTSAATIAGIKLALEAYSGLGTIVSALTGHGLKSSDKIGKLLDLP